MSSAQNQFDIVIVGGGPVGLSMAVALMRFMPELKLAICDRRPFTVPDDARAFALGAGVTRALEALDIWKNVESEAAPITRMEITDSGQSDLSRPLFLSFEGDVAPGRPYAHMVPNRALTAALLEALDDQVSFISPAGVTGFSVGPAMAEVSLDNGTMLRANLVIAADGGRSALRDMAGIKTISHDYTQSGLVTTISHELAHKQTAWEHFRPAGPFASLPLSGNRSSLVWTESAEQAAWLKAQPPEKQAERIVFETGNILGAVTLDEPVQSFPLSLRLARELVTPRLALIGDAAHVIHPIAGQGLNLGMKDVAVLSETVIDAARLGEDHGMLNVLERYQRRRRLDTALMATATDSLNRLFSNESAGLRIARDIGLGLVDRVPPLKSALIRQAAGVNGGPKLMRGEPI